MVESDLGERILQLMHLKPSHIVLPAIHIKREQVGELFEQERICWKNGPYCSVYRSGGSLLRVSSYIWNVCGIQI